MFGRNIIPKNLRIISQSSFLLSNKQSVFRFCQAIKPEGSQPNQENLISSKDVNLIPIDQFKYKDFLNLTKFTLSNANAFITAFCYTYFAQDHDAFVLTECANIYAASLLMAMSSQVFNQVMEWRQDTIMTRTCNRPIPRHKISTGPAFLIGLGLFGIANFLYYKYSTKEAFYIANTIFVGYVLVYSPLKRISQINTKVGALVGALPALLGAAAVKSSDIDNQSLFPFLNIQSLSIFTFMLSWQFNHFYGIYWMYQNDYIRAGFKMLNDSQKACREMRLMCILGTLSWLGMASQSAYYLVPVNAVTGLVAMYIWDWKVIEEFEKDPKKMAKILKTQSYKYYFAFFIGASGDLIYKACAKQLQKY